MAPSTDFIAELAAIAAEQEAIAAQDSLHIAPPAIQTQLSALLDRDDSLALFGPALSACVSQSPAGLNTVTPNPDRSLAGLHVDSWDGFVLAERRRGSNRLVVNVGAYPRYLLFVPYEVAGMDETLGWSDETGRDIARQFLLQSDRRVFRLEIRPGEAYLAPTENMIHDASSLGAESPDRALMLRGFLQANLKPHIPQKAADWYVPELARRVVLETVLKTLGGAGQVRIDEYRQGAVNDIYRLRTSGGDDLALRIRRRVSAQEEDGWLVKSALCADLVEHNTGRTHDAARTAATNSARSERIAFPGSAMIHAYRDGCAVVERPPWELVSWITGSSAGECAAPPDFVDLGRRLATLHRVGFSSFRTGLGPSSVKADGEAWLKERLYGLCTPALERRIGDRHADLLRRGHFEMAAVRWALLHGDLHAGNAIVSDEGVRIIDWDEATIGPPEFDFAPLRYATRQTRSGTWVSDASLHCAALTGYWAEGGVTDRALLTLGELLLMLKRFHTNHFEGRHRAAEAAVQDILRLTDQVLG
ncbi:phosphotransferase family protein [Sphingorhabdus profundilacus]|nr:aminoglycoside phosphotransferase family protein [Sphingorhabdus profundilacus]